MTRALLAVVFALCIFAGLTSAAFAQTPENAPPPVATLADILKDDTAREALIAELERIAEPATAEDVPAEAVEETVSIGRQFARITKGFAENAISGFNGFTERLSASTAVLDGLSGEEIAVLWETTLGLATVIAATVGIYLLLRILAKPLYRRMGSVAADQGQIRTLMILVASTVIDALVVIVAWACGYVLALTAIGDFGDIGIRQTLYLNAFLLVEMAKVALRAVLSPTTGDLRLVSMPDRAARVMSRWLGIVVSIVGYGQFLVVPIINQGVSFAAGRSVSVLLLFIALLILMAMTLSNRRAVAEWLLGERHLEERAGIVRFLARNWHLPVLAYLVGLFFIVGTRPDGMVAPVLSASGQIALAIVGGAMAARMLSRTIARGVILPGGVNQRLPLLQSRLNTFVPKALFLLRLAIIVTVAVFTFDILGAIDADAWMASRAGAEFIGSAISVVSILVVTFVVWVAFTSWIDWRLNPDFGRAPTAREQTLLSLLRNAVTVAIIVITLMFVLSEVGIDIAPLLASAGVLGLAIGFGAQKLVQDIITGVFIQLENAINVGDVVTTGGTTGTVERLTIRSVSLRDLHGTYHIIPFSSVDMVSNFMKEFSFYVCDMGVAYRESIDDAREAMIEAFEELKKDPAWNRQIIGDLQWFGLVSFGDSAIVLRARIKTVPGQQWATGRAYNEIVKRIFDARGIEIPFPHQTIYWGEDKQGSAPALQVRMQGAQGPAGKAAQSDSAPRADGYGADDSAPPQSDDQH